jgi:outer membrane immunogenic protein
MIRSTLSLTAVAFAMVGAAQAADLPRRGAPQQRFTPAVQSVPMWNGLYFGLNGGAIWGDFTKGGSAIDGKTSFTGGLTAGYQQQFGQFVAGVEADYNYSGLSGRGLTAPAGIATKGELTSFGTARGRLGVAFDRALVYGTGGLALGQMSFKGAPGSVSSSKTGYVIGGGLEYAFTQNISLKTEYLYMPLGATSLGVLGPGTKAGVSPHIVRAGVNYRF